MDTTESSNKYFLPVAVILAGILIAGAVIWNGSHSGGTAGGNTGGTPSANIANVNTSNAPYIGNANAPVTLAFWSDFQCPYCKQFELTTLPQIIQNYVSTGKVKIVFLDFPFLGKDSVTAAEYNHSIWKLYPDKYFAWRTAMYNAQDQEGDVGFGNASSIDKLDATIPGLDAAKIAADVKANAAAYDTMANAEKTEGSKQGVNATPAFIVGTQLILGAYPYSNFQSALDSLLNK